VTVTDPIVFIGLLSYWLEDDPARTDR